MEAQKQPSPWRSGLRTGATLGAAIRIWVTRHAGSAPPKSIGEVLARAERAGLPPAMIATFLLWLVVGIY